MENRLDYCCYWLGLSYIGVIPALVNHNLRQQALLHTLTVAKCRAVIFSQLQSPGLAEVADKVKRIKDHSDKTCMAACLMYYDNCYPGECAALLCGRLPAG